MSLAHWSRRAAPDSNEARQQRAGHEHVYASASSLVSMNGVFRKYVVCTCVMDLGCASMRTHETCVWVGSRVDWPPCWPLLRRGLLVTQGNGSRQNRDVFRGENQRRPNLSQELNLPNFTETHSYHGPHKFRTSHTTPQKVPHDQSAAAICKRRLGNLSSGQCDVSRSHHARLDERICLCFLQTRDQRGIRAAT